MLKDIAQLWLEGESYSNIYTRLNLNKIKISNKFCRIENIVDICEGGFGFDASLTFGSLNEILKSTISDDITDLLERLGLLQKRIKYGLPSKASIIIYELGFTDRVIALDLEQSIKLNIVFDLAKRNEIIRILKTDIELYNQVLAKYPTYFTVILQEVTNRTVN